MEKQQPQENAGEKAENKPEEKPSQPKPSGPKPEEVIGRLKEEIEALKDSRLRLLAEFDNYKKRTAREQIQLISSANEALVQDLIPVLENFERALHPDHKEKQGAIVKGVEMIYTQFNDLLKKAGLEEYNPPAGEEFNPDMHEAMVHEESKEVAANKITKVFSKGYKFNNKMIQFAKVAVSKGNSK